MSYGNQESKKTLIVHVKESDLPGVKAFLRINALDDDNSEAVKDLCLELHKWASGK